MGSGLDLDYGLQDIWSLFSNRKEEIELWTPTKRLFYVNQIPFSLKFTQELQREFLWYSGQCAGLWHYRKQIWTLVTLVH